MKTKEDWNVLVVCSMREWAGRDLFAGILCEISNKRNWHLDTVRPGHRFSCRELMNDEGEPYDGFILTMPGTNAMMERIAASMTPTVLVNITDRRLSARRDNFASVWSDNADIGRRAAKHLLECGKYKSAGFVHELGRPFYSDERIMAFRQEIKRGGYGTSVFPMDDDFENFFNRLKAWVRELPKPAAVMACSDMRAADVINACAAEGITVPSQVAVVGVDYDVYQHEKCAMSISSVPNNMHMMGRQAVRELDFLFRHPKRKGRPHEVLMPAERVYPGESSARSVSDARLVNMGLDFISSNRTRHITPAEVAAHLGCTRQFAEKRFAQIEGTTIRKAIEAARMDEAKRRIYAGETGRAVVKAMHFTSDNQFYRIYKRHFGETSRTLTRQNAKT